MKHIKEIIVSSTKFHIIGLEPKVSYNEDPTVIFHFVTR